MKIEQKDPNNLIEYAFNNRVHSDDQVDMIANSIKNFGFNQPIVIDEDNIILVGHGRLRAAKKLGLSHVPVLQLKDLDEVKKRAYRILDNKLAADSEWSAEGLNIELPWLESEGFDLEAWGLDELKLDFGEQEEITEDDFEPTEQKSLYVKKGDLIELGKHRLLCGDSCLDSDVALLMNAEKASLFVTDPPYGVSYADKNKFLNTIARGNRIQKEIEGDSQTPSEMKDFWQKAFTNASFATSEDASYYIFSPQGGDLMMMMSIKDANWQIKHMLVWVKNNHVLGRCDYHYKHEPILFGWKENSTHNFYGGSSQFSVWEFDKPMKNDLHPTMKPVGLIARAINNSSKPDDIILDLFLGSGTTLIAAEQTNRTCYGMEIDPGYCQVIIERYHKFCIDNEIESQIKVNGEPLDLELISQL